MRANNNQIFLDKIIWLATVFLFSSFLIFETKVWGKFVFIGLAILIFFLSAIKNKGKVCIKIEPFHVNTLIFVVYGFASILWARNPTYTILRMTTVFQTLVCIFIVYTYYRDQNSSRLLINAIMWSGYLCSLYTISFYGMSTIKNIIAMGDRIGNDFTNINGIGMISAISLVITFSRVIYKKFTYSIFFSPVALLLVVASGSRKALVVLLCGVLIVYFYKRIKKSSNPLNTIVEFLVAAVLICILLYFLLQLPFFSSVISRMDGLLNMFTGKGEVDVSTIHRIKYIEMGIEQFKKTPVFGIGIGNSPVLIGHNSYLHNNFIEILACGGILGFIFYYIPFIYALYYLIIKNKKRDEDTVLCIALLIIQIFMDFGQVSYFSKDVYFYLMLYYLQIKQIRKQKSMQT